jgi:hypothetical protein
MPDLSRKEKRRGGFAARPIVMERAVYGLFSG